MCPSWAATGLREIHINGDIAFAVWQFWRATQDAGLAWVNETAWPLLEVRHGLLFGPFLSYTHAPPGHRASPSFGCPS